MLRRLHDEVHVTPIFVTHDQAEAMDVASQIAVMNHVRIEQVGTPTELYDAPRRSSSCGSSARPARSVTVGCVRTSWTSRPIRRTVPSRR
jgi:ABC-type sugar transport system ATPase subunit